jgi:hypothetical protein
MQFTWNNNINAEQSWEDKDRREEELTLACITQGTPQCEAHAEEFCKVVFSGPVASEIK